MEMVALHSFGQTGSMPTSSVTNTQDIAGEGRQSPEMHMNGRYVLLTAAKDEEAYIEKTIESVAAQTLLPARWIVVDDGSRDETATILRRNEDRFKFLSILDRQNVPRERSFASKADALRLAWGAVQDLDYEYVGILDADIELPTNFYAEMISCLAGNPDLGLTSGWVCELVDNEFRPCSTNRIDSVDGDACQIFRRESYEQIGGIPSMRHGGEDTLAMLLVEMGGWRAYANDRVWVKHLKPAGHAAGSWPRIAYNEGLRAYFLGYHPAYVLAKAVRRIPEQPLFARSLCQLLGYVGCAIRGRPHDAPAEVVEYLRNKQIAALVPWRSHSRVRRGEGPSP